MDEVVAQTRELVLECDPWGIALGDFQEDQLLRQISLAVLAIQSDDNNARTESSALPPDSVSGALWVGLRCLARSIYKDGKATLGSFFGSDRAQFELCSDWTDNLGGLLPEESEIGRLLKICGWALAHYLNRKNAAFSSPEGEEENDDESSIVPLDQHGCWTFSPFEVLFKDSLKMTSSSSSSSSSSASQHVGFTSMDDSYSIKMTATERFICRPPGPKAISRYIKCLEPILFGDDKSPGRGNADCWTFKGIEISLIENDSTSLTIGGLEVGMEDQNGDTISEISKFFRVSSRKSALASMTYARTTGISKYRRSVGKLFQINSLILRTAGQFLTFLELECSGMMQHCSMVIKTDTTKLKSMLWAVDKELLDGLKSRILNLDRHERTLDCLKLVYSDIHEYKQNVSSSEDLSSTVASKLREEIILDGNDATSVTLTLRYTEDVCQVCSHLSSRLRLAFEDPQKRDSRIKKMLGVGVGSDPTKPVSDDLRWIPDRPFHRSSGTKVDVRCSHCVGSVKGDIGSNKPQESYRAEFKQWKQSRSSEKAQLQSPPEYDKKYYDRVALLKFLEMKHRDVYDQLLSWTNF